MAISVRVARSAWSGLRRWLLMGAVITGVTVFLGACAGQGSATGIPENLPVRVDTSSMFVSIQNQAGLPLTNIRLSIVPRGAGAPFTAFMARLENEEKRDFVLGAFRGNDGTAFSLRVARPKSVRIEASDLNGKKYEVDYPWTD